MHTCEVFLKINGLIISNCLDISVYFIEALKCDGYKFWRTMYMFAEMFTSVNIVKNKEDSEKQGEFKLKV